jgi:recombination protein RecT
MSTALATAPRNGGELTIKQRLQSPELIAELGKAMPKHCRPERMARIAITALTRTPKLAECTQASFFECLLSLSQWGLEPDGRRAHLIPYGNKCTLIVDYKGYVELAYRSGFVKNIHADVVREGDIFEYASGRILNHVPHFLRRDEDKPAQSGKVYAAYCVVELTGETVKSEVLSFDEVEAIRKRSRAGSNGPWVTDWSEMAKKTAFRRASKWIPLSADVRDALDRDDDRAGIEPSIQSRAGVRTVEDLGAILAGDAIEGEASETDGGERTPEDVDAGLVERFRGTMAECKDTEAIEAAVQAMSSCGDAVNEATWKAIDGAVAARRAELSPAPKGKKQGSLVS